jgi:RHS repeat-associated protein
VKCRRLRDVTPAVQGNMVEKRKGLSDANHNVVAVADGDGGEVVERYVYDAYGRPTVYSPTWTDPASPATDGPLYCGYHFDTETALYQVRHRYYDSSLSTFISRDPIEADKNLYRYCYDNPAKLTDPLGLACSASVCLGGIGHCGIQVEWDEWRWILHTTKVQVGTELRATTYTDPCGNQSVSTRTVPIWGEKKEWTYEIVHVTYCIELVRGGPDKQPPGTPVFGSGPAGLGPFGQTSKDYWSIVERPGACSGTCTPIKMNGSDPCSVVNSIIHSAIAVGAAADGKQYYLDQGGSTCNSVCWSILTGAGVNVPPDLPGHPGWGHPMR